MSTLTKSRKLATKAFAATVIGGALTVGAAAPAFATTTTTTTSGSTPARGHCARAPKALSRLAKVEGKVSKRITTLESVESKLTGSNYPKAAARVEKRIHRLQRIESRAGTRVAKINARCPSGTTGSGSTSA